MLLLDLKLCFFENDRGNLTLNDDSDDSYSRGFVPNTAITGKAFMIWFSWDQDTDRVRWRRIGTLLP